MRTCLASSSGDSFSSAAEIEFVDDALVQLQLFVEKPRTARDQIRIEVLRARRWRLRTSRTIGSFLRALVLLRNPIALIQSTDGRRIADSHERIVNSRSSVEAARRSAPRKTPQSPQYP